jgi:O-antigen/teichoic acid export membrane protein
VATHPGKRRSRRHGTDIVRGYARGAALTQVAATPTSAVGATARGGAANVVGAGLSAVLNLVIVLAVTRSLSKPDAGFVFTATAIYVLIETLSNAGTGVGLVHFISSDLARGERHRIPQVVWASLVPVAAISLVGAALTVAVSPVLLRALGTAAINRHADTAMVIVAIGIPIGALYDALTAATRGLGSARPTVLVEKIGRPLLQGIGVFIAAASGASSVVLVVAWVAPYAIAAPVMAVWFVRMMRSAGVPLYSAQWPQSLRPVWSFTAPRALTGVFQVLLQRLDILLVGGILGASAAAVYTGATRFVVVGQLGNQAVSYAFQPQLARLVATQRLEEARELFRVSAAWIVGLCGPLYMAVCVTAPWLVQLLGAKYQAGVWTMVVVTGTMFVGNACGLVDVVLVTLGRTSLNMLNVAVALVLNVSIDVVLIPHIGIIGAAIGWAVAILVNNVLPVIQVHRSNGFTPFSRLWLQALISIGLLFGVLPGIFLLIFGSKSVLVIPALVVATGIYLVIVWRRREVLNLGRIRPVTATASA